MHCERQLHAIRDVEPQHAVLHVDSSGKFCKITEEMNNLFKQLMNYVFLLKDVSDFNKPGVKL